MGVPLLLPAFTAGEVSPSLFGRFDLARMHTAASTMRNMWVNYHGGAYSRAGTKFVGFSRQTGRSLPPRTITFQKSINQGLALEFGHQYMRVVSNGAFVTEAPINISGISQSSPGVIGLASSTPVNGDWYYISGVSGMTQVNGGVYVAHFSGPFNFAMFDVYGNPVDTTAFGAYTGGGTVARIFTLVTPWADQDLNYLKLTESADTMTICCVNPVTGTEYVPQDLTRTSDSSWSLTPSVPTTSVAAPATTSAVPSAAGTVQYQYVVTTIADDGTESVASPIATSSNSVDIAATAGSITVSWSSVLGINQYNVYKASPAFNTVVPVGALFGFAGLAYGTSLVDGNIVPDLAQVPPEHRNPFARGQIIGAPINTQGSGLVSTVVGNINTSTGSGAQIDLVVDPATHVLTAVIIRDPGHDYAPGDTLSFTVGAGVAPGTITLEIGAETGTYPAVVAYFQQRRAFGNSLNEPDTYWLSQPGAFLNFDVRNPTIATDAITGTPWSVQVNGIQFFVPMPGGLVVMTGLEAYLLSGTGGSAFTPQPLTPSSQQALPQGFNGCNATVPPIRIYQDILYVQAKGSVYRDFTFNINSYTFTGSDLTVNSSQLFIGQDIKNHAWCEEPYKQLWAVRGDGIMLNLTWLKDQQVVGWSRHDTNGFFESVCSVIEPPVDALYAATQRFPGSNTAYMIERMDNRIWQTVEDCWCVDCGLELSQPTPAAVLTASSATGLGSITGVTGPVGGQGYSAATTASVVDANGNGAGTGAIPALTIVAGIITAVTFTGPNQGSGYTQPKLVITDPANAGSGASAALILNNQMVFSASAGVFGAGDVGSVIRMGGGIATITAFQNAQTVTANITVPITVLRPNSGGTPQTAAAGDWTMTKPITTISGLGHLAGATVTGLADGNVITPRVVSAAGTITLDAPASAVIVGLGFTAQLQTVYLDSGEPTIQGQRKKIAEVTARIENSREFTMGSNQPDGSTQNPIQVETTWFDMADVPSDGPNFPPKPYNATATPLRTGDIRIPVEGGFGTPGQVAIQQTKPLPLQISALIPEGYSGDTPQNQYPKRQQGKSA